MGKMRRPDSREGLHNNSRRTAIIGTGLFALTAVAVIAGMWFDNNRSDTKGTTHAAVYAPPQRLSVSIIGDNYTVGVGAPKGKGYIARVCNDLAWQCQTDAQSGTGYTSAGRPAEGFSIYGDRLDEVIDRQPSVVVIQGGTNDSDASYEAIEAAALKMFTTLRKGVPDAKVIVVSTTNPPGIIADRALPVRDALSAAASATGATFVDPIAERWLDPASDYITLDNMHPTEEAYVKYADRWTAAMRAQGATGPSY